MAANIEQIFQDFILNKIREIEDQQEDNGPVKALASESYAPVKTEPDSERDEKEEDSHGAALKKHKKHKKHKSKKSKKKKKKRDREEKESSSESGVESEGQSKHRSSRTPGEEANDGDGNRKLSRHKQHLMGKKKKRKRRKEDGRSSSDSESEGSRKGGSRCPASSLRRKEDLPDIIPKEDGSKKGGATSEKGGGRSHTSRSRVPTRSRSRSARRVPRSRSRSRPRGRRSRSRSRSRSRRGRIRSTSRSRRGRTRSTSRSRRGRTRSTSRSRRVKTRSTSRSRRGRTRSTSRSRRAKTKSTSRSRSQLAVQSRKTKSRSTSPQTRRSRTRSGSAVRGSGPDKKPSADPVATETEPPDSRLPGIEHQVTDPLVDPLVPTPTDPPIPSPDPSPAGAVVVKAAGSWKPLPPLEVVTSASLSQKDVSAQPPEGLAGEPAALLPVSGEESCGAAAEEPAHGEPQSTDPGADASAQSRGEGAEEASPLQREDPGPPSPGPGNIKSSPVPPGAADPGPSTNSPHPPEKPSATATVADGNESSSKSSAQRRRPSSKSPQKKKTGDPEKSSRLRSRSNSPSRRRSSRSGSRPGRKRSGSKRKRSGSKRKRSGSRRKRSGSRRKRSGSRRKRSGSRRKRSGSRRKRSRSRRRRSGSRRKRSRSRSRKKSRSRSPARRPKRSRSGSPAQRRGGGYGGGFSQRDRWKREPSRSPVLILRKNRSPAPKNCGDGKSPSRITELDKDQLLEIAKANAAAMCTKAGVPIPESLKPRLNSQMQLPLAMPLPNMAMNAAVASMAAATMTAALSSMGALSSMPPLPSITNKPPPGAPPMDMAALEVVKKKVTKQANSISIKEFTDKCKMIVDSKGELPVAQPHVSDEEDEGKPFGSAGLREQRAISFSLNNMSVRPAARSDAGIAKEFPVSSGSQHRKKEGEAPGAYGEWVAVEKMSEKAAKAAAAAVAAAVKAAAAPATSATSASSPRETVPETQQPPTTAAPPAGTQASAAPASDSVFPEPPLQPVDISQAVTERIKAQRRLAENPYDVSAISMLSRAQEQVDAWAQSNTIPGLFTGSTGATVLSSEELSNSGPQAWLKKDQFLRAAPVSGGVGEFLMRKMGWRTGEGLGRNREGTVEPIIIDFKIDRKGLVANGEKPQKQTGGLVVTKDLMGKHPVSALIELCNKRHITQPDFVMVHHSGPDHRKNFLFKVTVNSVDYQPQTASPNKKHAKAMAAMVALQGLGEVPADGPGLYTGPVFTAASTGPLFST